jgi:hypothetical protein
MQILPLPYYDEKRWGDKALEVAVTHQYGSHSAGLVQYPRTMTDHWAARMHRWGQRNLTPQQLDVPYMRVSVPRPQIGSLSAGFMDFVYQGLMGGSSRVSLITIGTQMNGQEGESTVWQTFRDCLPGLFDNTLLPEWNNTGMLNPAAASWRDRIIGTPNYIAPIGCLSRSAVYPAIDMASRRREGSRWFLHNVRTTDTGRLSRLSMMFSNPAMTFPDASVTALCRTSLGNSSAGIRTAFAGLAPTEGLLHLIGVRTAADVLYTHTAQMVQPLLGGFQSAAPGVVTLLQQADISVMLHWLTMSLAFRQVRNRLPSTGVTSQSLRTLLLEPPVPVDVTGYTGHPSTLNNLAYSTFAYYDAVRIVHGLVQALESFSTAFHPATFQTWLESEQRTTTRRWIASHENTSRWLDAYRASDHAPDEEEEVHDDDDDYRDNDDPGDD